MRFRFSLFLPPMLRAIIFAAALFAFVSLRCYATAIFLIRCQPLCRLMFTCHTMPADVTPRATSRCYDIDIIDMA